MLLVSLTLTSALASLLLHPGRSLTRRRAPLLLGAQGGSSSGCFGSPSGTR